jgi:VanZ family protein
VTDQNSHSSRAILRRYLAAGYAFLIVYASLSPFTNWQEQGLEFAAVLRSPLVQTYSWFDAVSNLVAYFPFGLLLGMALRARLGATLSVLFASIIGLLLSGSMEYLQLYLPNRTSSNMDLITNGLGCLVGALLAISIVPRAWFSWLTHWHSQLFRRGHDVDFGLALVFLWMFGQSNPSLPMLGNVFITHLAQQPFAPLPLEPLDWLESVAVALNFLMLGGLFLTLLRERRHAVAALMTTLCSIALIKFMTAAMLLKSWALLLWLNSEALLGIAIGVILLMGLGTISRRKLNLPVASITVLYLILTNFILDDVAPSAAMPLYQWRYGHLLNYNGLSDTISLIFPLLLLFYVWRRAQRPTESV